MVKQNPGTWSLVALMVVFAVNSQPHGAPRTLNAFEGATSEMLAWKTQ
jgi:hypothetical protein